MERRTMYKKCTSCGNCVEVKRDGMIVKNRKLDAYCFYCVSDKFATGARKIGSKASWTGRTPKWCPVEEDNHG